MVSRVIISTIEYAKKVVYNVPGYTLSKAKRIFKGKYWSLFERYYNELKQPIDAYANAIKTVNTATLTALELEVVWFMQFAGDNLKKLDKMFETREEYYYNAARGPESTEEDMQKWIDYLYYAGTGMWRTYHHQLEIFDKINPRFVRQDLRVVMDAFRKALTASQNLYSFYVDEGLKYNKAYDTTSEQLSLPDNGKTVKYWSR